MFSKANSAFTLASSTSKLTWKIQVGHATIPHPAKPMRDFKNELVLSSHLQSNLKAKSGFWQNCLMSPSTGQQSSLGPMQYWIFLAGSADPEDEASPIFCSKYHSLIMPFLTDTQLCALFLLKKISMLKKKSNQKILLAKQDASLSTGRRWSWDGVRHSLAKLVTEEQPADERQGWPFAATFQGSAECREPQWGTATPPFPHQEGKYAHSRVGQVGRRGEQSRGGCCCRKAFGAPLSTSNGTSVGLPHHPPAWSYPPSCTSACNHDLGVRTHWVGGEEKEKEDHGT